MIIKASNYNKFYIFTNNKVYNKFYFMYNNYMKIGSVELKNDLLLAPMAGYTDVGFRKVCRDCGCALSYTEMVSAKALIYDSKKSQELLITEQDESPKAVQIFGHEPDIMAEVCKNGALEKFDIIDINMGCPAPKIVKNGDGSFLLTNINLATEIVTKCVKSTNKPITVKMRLGYDDEFVATEFAKRFEEAGVSAITVHGRTKNQMYAGSSDYDKIRLVKDSVSIPIIANGDVKDKESYNKIKSVTNCDFVMIGRASVGNPMVFSQILGTNSNMTKLDCIINHIAIMQKYYTEKFIVLNMRKHIACLLKGENVTSEQKQKIMTIETLSQLIDYCKTILN